MGRLRKSLINRARNNSTQATTSTNEVDHDEEGTEENNDKTPRQDERDIISAYNKFQTELEEYVNHAEPGRDRSCALSMWIEVSHIYLIDRLNKPEDIEPFTKLWLTHALRGQTTDNSDECITTSSPQSQPLLP